MLTGSAVTRALAVLATVAMLPVAAQESFAAPLQWVPIGGSERNEVAGDGSANARLTGTRLSIEGTFSGLPGKATGAKLRRGVAPGARGHEPAVVADLKVEGDTTGTVSGDVRLTGEQIEALKAGRLYLEIYTERGVPPDHATLWGWLAAPRARR